jgi:hypothetical protein
VLFHISPAFDTFWHALLHSVARVHAAATSRLGVLLTVLQATAARSVCHHVVMGCYTHRFRFVRDDDSGNGVGQDNYTGDRTPRASKTYGKRKVLSWSAVHELLTSGHGALTQAGFVALVAGRRDAGGLRGQQ